MSIPVYVKYIGELDELIYSFPILDKLKRMDLRFGKKPTTCSCDVSALNMDGRQVINLIQITLLGKTGYGKSSLANRLSQQDVFDVDDVGSCTRSRDISLFHISGDHYLAILDLPGVGENAKLDEEYLQWYQHEVRTSAAVIYVLRADQRDISVDLSVFNQLWRNSEDLNKVIIAVNCIDKLEPVNRHSSSLTDEQIISMERKKKWVSQQFGIAEKSVIGCSAHTGYGTSLLMNAAVSQIIK